MRGNEMYYSIVLLFAYSAPLVAAGAGVCSDAGNFSDVAGWNRAAEYIKNESKLALNSFDFEGAIRVYSQIVSHIGVDGDYWSDETKCAGQLFHKTAGQDINGQASHFSTALLDNMAVWSECVTSGNISCMVGRAQATVGQFNSIIEQAALVDDVELAWLQIFDSGLLSIVTMAGTVGRLIDLAGELSQQELCGHIETYSDNATTLMDTLETLMLDVDDNQVWDWSVGVVICHAGGDIPPSCPALPWPYFWVHDTYTHQDVYFAQTVGEADNFSKNYKLLIESTVDSLYNVLHEDLNWFIDVTVKILALYLFECKM